MRFESVIFQFEKTPNGRIEILPKEKMKALLKGMSPDLIDNIILLCGGTYFDCYRMLRDDAGVMRKTMQAQDMLYMLSMGDKDNVEMERARKARIRNRDEILNIISSI